MEKNAAVRKDGRNISPIIFDIFCYIYYLCCNSMRFKIFKFIIMLLGYKLVGSRLSPKRGTEYLIQDPGRVFYE